MSNRIEDLIRSAEVMRYLLAGYGWSDPGLANAAARAITAFDKARAGVVDAEWHDDPVTNSLLSKDGTLSVWQGPDMRWHYSTEFGQSGDADTEAEAKRAAALAIYDEE